MRRFWISTTIGVALASTPLLVQRFLSPQTEVLRDAAALLWLPGGYAGLLVARGRIDDIDFRFADFANFVVYFALTYLAITFLAKRREKVSTTA